MSAPQTQTCLATLKRSEPETPQARHLEFTLENPALLQTYQLPGQYAIVTLGQHKPGFFALSNPPGEENWSLLVKQSSPLTAALLALKPGDAFTVSQAQGKGFAMEKAAGKNVLLFAAGSGIAPIRAAIWTMLKKRGAYRNIALHYGARNPDEFAYEREFLEWTRKKVTLLQTVSNQGVTVWEGAKGYVQNLIASGFPVEDTVALLCGMKGMIEGVTDKLISLGVPGEQILTNY